MSRVLLTGSSGFIGRNFSTYCSTGKDISIIPVDVGDRIDEVLENAGDVDAVVHLAGVNRPERQEDFFKGNAEFTESLLSMLANGRVAPPVIMTSSIQVHLDNEYGRSKLLAEDSVVRYSSLTGAKVAIYRLPNVFGKWCRPNYNSVVATFCYNAAHGLELVVHDDLRELELVYVDDVVKSIRRTIEDVCSPSSAVISYPEIPEKYTVSLGELAAVVRGFASTTHGGRIPELGSGLVKRLYSTYLSYLDSADLEYAVELKNDNRGWLFEFVKNEGGGQVFVSKSHRGVVRGNHFHHSKIERFCLVQGSAVIRLRRTDSSDVLSFPVDDSEIRVVQIPPGYVHSIECTSSQDAIVLFWANEPFDATASDTFPRGVVE